MVVDLHTTAAAAEAGINLRVAVSVVAVVVVAAASVAVVLTWLPKLPASSKSLRFVWNTARKNQIRTIPYEIRSVDSFTADGRVKAMLMMLAAEP